MKQELNERLLQLMADQSTGDLDPKDHGEYQELMGDSDDFATSMEYAAAAATIAMLTEEEPMPESLRDRILAEAPNQDGGNVVSMTPASKQPPQPASSGFSFGWLVAAALLLLTILAWWPEPQPLTSSQRLAALMENASDVKTVAFGATEDPYASGSSGQVIWSNERQEGYMRISGLHVNDKTVDQYQLWIFDKQRDDRYPIDGGIFDIPQNGEVIVPIDARLAVLEPSLFAITVEEPGGVVVSNRERIVLAAQL